MESKQDPMAALIGGLLGGQEQSSTGDVGGVLQNLLGGQSGASGAQAQPSGDLGGLLGGMLGGQGAGGLAGLLGGSGLLDGVVNALAQKMGLSPEIAQTVVAFLLRNLLGGQSGPAASSSTKPWPSSTSKPKPSSSKPRPSSSKPSAKPRPKKPKPGQDSGGALDLGGLLGGLLGGGASGQRALDAPGLAQQLAQETGLDEETAARSLQEAMGLLSQRS